MRKTKILAVAPYEGMARILTSIAQQRDDISLTVQIGDLNTGKEIALQLAHKNYDVIISRGGTAELIHSVVELPVIDISISVYDVLRNIKLAESYSGKFAIAGFAGITSCAHLLCDLLQYNIDIITFTNENSAIPALRQAKQNGCSLVLCDMAGANAAKKLGLNSLLISSGIESISNAIDEAVKLVLSSNHVHKQKDLFQGLLTEEDREFLIYNPAGTLWFSSLAIDEINISLMNLVQTYLNAFFKISNQTIVRQIRDDLYILTNRHLYYEEQKYTAITIKKQKAITAEDDLGITISNRPDHTDNDFLHFYQSFNQMRDISQILEEYAKYYLPILIIGETGTGKDKAAYMLYEKGPYKNAPFYTINCELMGERKWNNLLSNENSPLNTVHSTIYFKSLSSLTKTQLDKLFHYIEQSSLLKRNRLIFSLISNNENYASTENTKIFLENRLSSLTIKLPSLKERKDEFPSIIALYIHRLNVSLGKQIIGLETEAMDFMTSFSWPQNLSQLQHVLQELVVLTQTPYISLKDVKEMLKQELSVSSYISTSFDLKGTLEEINYKIIQMILAEEKGSKEKTAARLGISRSTLWRILKSHDIK